MIKAVSSAGSPGRGRAKLSANLDKNLLTYAVAASAAGVSLLALAQPADAKIVYTKANSEIAPNKTLNLNLNHDRHIDFVFSNCVYETTSNRGPFIEYLAIAPSGRNGVLGHASVLASGISVGPKRRFQARTVTMLKFSQYCTPDSLCDTHISGAWKNITGSYLGLKFFIRGQAHFGWARLNVTLSDKGIYAMLTGYAYETVANRPIITGDTKGEDSASGVAA